MMGGGSINEGVARIKREEAKPLRDVGPHLVTSWPNEICPISVV